MASVVERGGRYLVRVRKEGYRPVSKTFTRKSDAVAYGKKVEVLMEQGAWVEEGQKVPSFAEALTTIPFKVPAREPVSWGNEEATGERDLGSGD